MGFSNNKWRKILTILMIINLAIILLSKLSKVFASYDFTLNDTNITVPDDVWANAGNYPYTLIVCKYGLQNKDQYTFSYYYGNSAFTTEYYKGRVLIDTPNPFWNSTYVYDFSDVSNSHWFSNGIKYNASISCYDPNYDVIVYSSHDIYYNNNIYIPATPTFVYPFFDNSTEIENGNPDGVYISAGDYSNTDNLYFHLLQIDTGLSNSDTSVYYYSDKTFILNKDSEYYRTWYDPNIEGYYYFIPRYELGLSQNTSYLYVLNNSNNQIQNSYGIYEKDVSNGIYDVVQSDTAGVITATEEETDRMKNIEQTLINNQNSMENIENTITDTNVSQDTQTDIDTNLNFNNSAPQFSSLFNGFFSRLTSTISDLGNYQDTDVITVNLPIPFTNDTIPIRSDFIFSNQNNNFLKNISTLLWYFIFGRYFLYFLINTYWLITNGQFFKFYLTQKEAITSDML